MATIIRILPDDAINKIAAGEVVERPASIVKELVENAIDAGADRITVEIASGGRDRIRVTDTGCGMSHDDALLSLERHATSKIRSADDLWDLRTLGFRGEAIPSIASVSRMSIETRDRQSSVGTRVDIDGGVIRQVSEVGRTPGTSVTVSDVFFNTPARRKYLKGTDTEWRHISQAITGLALAHEDIGFSLSHDGREALRLAGGTIEERLEALFRIRIGDGAILLQSERQGLKVEGYVVAPETAKKSASQVIVVNGRWVRHRGIVQAVKDGYGGLLPKETSPSFALCVTVDPDTIDVNVHPSKREVKCSDSRSVYRSVADTVRSAVREGGDIPEWTTVEASPIMINNGGRADDETLTQPIRYGPTISGHSVASDVPARLREPLSLDDSQIALPLSMQEQDEAVRSETEPDGVPRQPQQRFFQLHGSYILAQVKQGLIAVDQHLAHQRVLYDQAVEHVAGEGSTAGQALLFPGTFEFGFNEIVIVREVMPFLERMGFGIRDFGGNTIVVDAIPAGLESWNEGDLLRDIVGDLISERTAHLDLGDRALDPTAHYLAVSYARRVAIPHGKAMQQEEMENLIDQLFACSEPYTTPTGRPTLTRLTLEDISRRFAP